MPCKMIELQDIKDVREVISRRGGCSATPFRVAGDVDGGARSGRCPDDCGVPHLRSAEKELHIFGSQFFKSLALIFVNSAPDQVGLLFLELNDSGLDRVFDGQAGDHAGPLLANSVTAIRALPFCCRVPPAASRRQQKSFATG